MRVPKRRLPTPLPEDDRLKKFQQRMAQQGIHTLDDLWNAVGADPRRGIEDVAALPGPVYEPDAEAAIVRTLADCAAEEARNSGASWLTRNWLEYGLALSVLLLLLPIGRAVPGWSFGVFPLRPALVTAHALPAGHVLRAG